MHATREVLVSRLLSKEGRKDFDLDLLLEHANCAARLAPNHPHFIRLASLVEEVFRTNREVIEAEQYWLWTIDLLRERYIRTCCSGTRSSRGCRPVGWIGEEMALRTTYLIQSYYSVQIHLSRFWFEKCRAGVGPGRRVMEMYDDVFCLFFCGVVVLIF